MGKPQWDPYAVSGRTFGQEEYVPPEHTRKHYTEISREEYERMAAGEAGPHVSADRGEKGFVVRETPLDAHESTFLDPRDPFERVLIPIVEMNRKKRADYAYDDDPFSNFGATATFARFGNRWMSALFNCAQKLARASALTANDRDPVNEGMYDTLLDNAVYAIIALSIYEHDATQPEAAGTVQAPLERPRA